MSRFGNVDLTDPQQLDLALQPPLKSIMIDGHEYAVGLLSEAQWADIDGRAERLLRAVRSGAEISDADANPTRHLFHLLLAGDPNVRPVGKISAENIITAAQEIMRQAAVRALVPCVMTRSAERMAQAERNVKLAEELVARQVELISDLKARGCDTTDPQRLLRQFQELLATNVAERYKTREEISVAPKVRTVDETPMMITSRSGVK